MLEKLTRQEQKVFDMLLEGNSLNDIAFKLNIVYKTVDYHKSNIYRKLNVKNIQEFYFKYGTKKQNDFLVNSNNENEQAAIVQYPVKNLKRLFLPACIVFAAALIIITAIFFIWNIFSDSSVFSVSAISVSRASVEKPLILTFFDNQCAYSFSFPPFESSDITITKDDNFTFYYTFTSDVDLQIFHFVFIDNSIEFYTMLSPGTHIKSHVKANTEYSDKVTVIANRTANSPQPNANLMYLHTYYYEGNPPTITFTRFELVRN
ncbi:MAG: helix-turn-helix transcriptional regulator [Treponema sp.]|nr:helix-turn-helix transcriptional regulator [Treponema sp.]